jgi:translation initiation factor 3 subunit G
MTYLLRRSSIYLYSHFIEAPEAETKDVAPVSSGGRYVPPSLRNRDPDANREDASTLRLTNLPDYCTDRDLRDLCGFKPLARAFLAKDFDTGKCKGYAFVTYSSRDDAAQALAALNGHGYGNLILKAEWAAPK